MPGLKEKKHLFFDLDDTLWDFQKNSGQVMQELYLEFDLENKLKVPYTVFFEAYRQINYRFWSLYYKKQIDKNHLRNHRFNETFKEFGYDNYDENLLITGEYLSRSPKGRHLKEGCIEVLEYLGAKYQLHIITNGFKEVQHIKLTGCDLKKYFKHVIISEEYNLIKPEEKIFRLAEEMAGAAKHECVMIGDSLESDVEGALNAGWDAVYFTGESEHGHKGHSIQKLRELIEMF